MCREERPDRSVTLYEGHVRCIMELDTPEEKLAALETVFSIAFPKDDDIPYVPPKLPNDGTRLSAEDKARRLAYNIFSGLIKFHGKKGESRIKDQRKVGAGRIGAMVRWGDSSVVSLDDSQENLETEQEEVGSADSTAKATIVAKSALPQPIAEDDFSSAYEAGRYRFKRELTKEEKAAIAEWDRKIPDAKALHAYIEKNFLYATRKTALKSEFCEFAYHQLAKVDRWTSTRDRRPFRDIRLAIHYIALSYNKQLQEVKLAEDEEKRKNLESEFRLKNTELSQISSTDLADMERRRRRKAEKEAMDKVMKGEL